MLSFVSTTSNASRKVTGGGKERTFWHIRHPEHTGKYATATRLEELRAPLARLQKFLTVDLAYVRPLTGGAYDLSCGRSAFEPLYSTPLLH